MPLAIKKITNPGIIPNKRPAIIARFHPGPILGGSCYPFLFTQRLTLPNCLSSFLLGVSTPKRNKANNIKIIARGRINSIKKEGFYPSMLDRLSIVSNIAAQVVGVSFLNIF